MTYTETEIKQAANWLAKLDTDFYIGQVYLMFETSNIGISASREKLVQFLEGALQVEQQEHFSTCEDKDHDQLFRSGDSDECDCSYALDMEVSHWKETNMDTVAKVLLDEDQPVTPIIIGEVAHTRIDNGNLITWPRK
ncbi:MAG: hypothetical protein MKZ81_06495 [Dehalococcoidia bacterium]|nr:hypothetical protein [Dehalococcoidia bacterium]